MQTSTYMTYYLEKLHFGRINEIVYNTRIQSALVEVRVLTVKADLESHNLKMVGARQLVSLAIEALCVDHPVMLVCDLGAAGDSDTRQEYVTSLVKADVLNSEHVEKATSNDTQLVVLPFLTLTIAENVYRQIAHASHFVTMWVDGEPYAAGC